MSILSQECQDIVAHALVARRRELQLQAAFMPGPSFLRDDLTHAFVEAAKARLRETEAAMRELDKRTIPWLHCHPDCSDLFAAEEPLPVPHYSYQITPRTVPAGGGWRLQLLENGQEVGGGAFPAEEGAAEAQAYLDAASEGEEWLLARALHGTSIDEAQAAAVEVR